MNAIMSLCHFCENHGPSVIFCTHPLRPDDNPGKTHNPVVRTPSSSSDSASAQARIRKPDTCEGCHSIEGGYVTHDDEAGLSYVSKQYPHHPLVFSMVRQACVRSLSCEVCPGREGPIFFGDEQRGHVLSYTFYISDAQSRGLHRWYSILVCMMDKIYLLNSWPFLVPNIQQVIENIQVKAKLVYDQEQAKCPQRPLRLQTSMTPLNFRQQRGVNKSPRSLIELTNDKNVFKMLHVTFTWIIKACGNRICETLLEGPPTEDSIIDMEKQEETEEGFIKLFSKKLSVGDNHEGDATQIHDSIDSVISHGHSQVENIDMLRQIMKKIGKDKFHVLAHNTVVGNQIIVRGDNQRVVAAILSAIKILLPKGCCRVIGSSDRYEESWKCNFLGLPLSVSIPNHVVSNEQYLQLNIYNKQTTQSNDRVECRLKTDKNTKEIYDFTEHEWTSDKQGRATQVSSENAPKLETDHGILEHTNSTHDQPTDIGHVNIECQEQCMDSDNDREGSMLDANFGEARCLDDSWSLDEFDLAMRIPMDIPDKSPTVLSSMEAALLNDNLTNKVVEQCLICLKEEWMNKVKVLFKFTKAGGGRSEEDTKKLIQVVGACSEDMPLLKFWMTGLSVQYRTHILSSSKNA